MKKPFMAVGGVVFSKHDGQVHHIGPTEVARLYRVPVELCHLVRSRQDLHESQAASNHLILYPRNDGNYDLADALSRSC